MNRVFGCVCSAVLLGSLAGVAADVRMTGGDASGTSSLNSVGKWSNGAAPSAGNTYFVNNTLRLNTACEGAVFAGDSLVISNGTLVLQGVKSVTIPDLVYQSGALATWQSHFGDYLGGVSSHVLKGRLTVKNTSPNSGNNSAPAVATERSRGICIDSELHGTADTFFQTAANRWASQTVPAWYIKTMLGGDLSDFHGTFISHGILSENYRSFTTLCSPTAVSTFDCKVRLRNLGGFGVEKTGFTDGAAVIAPPSSDAWIEVENSATNAFIWAPNGTETCLELDIRGTGSTSGGHLLLQDAGTLTLKDHVLDVRSFALTNGLLKLLNTSVAATCRVSTGRDGLLLADDATFEKGFTLTPDLRLMSAKGGTTVSSASEVGQFVAVLTNLFCTTPVTLAGLARLAPKVQVFVALQTPANVYLPSVDYEIMTVPASCGAVSADMFDVAVLDNPIVPNLLNAYGFRTFGTIRIDVRDNGDRVVVLTNTGLDWQIVNPAAGKSYLTPEINLSGVALETNVHYIAEKKTIRTVEELDCVFPARTLTVLGGTTGSTIALKSLWFTADIRTKGKVSLAPWQCAAAILGWQELRGTLDITGTSVSNRFSVGLQNNRDVVVASEVSGDADQYILVSNTTQVDHHARVFLDGLNTNYLGRIWVQASSNASIPEEKRRSDLVISRTENLGGARPAFMQDAVGLFDYGGLTVTNGTVEIVDPNCGVRINVGRLTVSPGARLALRSSTLLNGSGARLLAEGGGTVAVGGTAVADNGSAQVEVAAGTAFLPLVANCFTNANVILSAGARVAYDPAVCDPACLEYGWMNARAFTAEGPFSLEFVMDMTQDGVRTLALPLFTLLPSDAAAVIDKLPGRMAGLPERFAPVYAVEDVAVGGVAMKRIVATFRDVGVTMFLVR